MPIAEIGAAVDRHDWSEGSALAAGGPLSLCRVSVFPRMLINRLSIANQASNTADGGIAPESEVPWRPRGMSRFFDAVHDSRRSAGAETSNPSSRSRRNRWKPNRVDASACANSPICLRSVGLPRSSRIVPDRRTGSPYGTSAPLWRLRITSWAASEVDPIQGSPCHIASA